MVGLFNYSTLIKHYTMATYNQLELEHYYLVRETEGGEITLVQPIMETSKCFLVLTIDEIETTAWKKKEDSVAEIIEELTEEQVDEFEEIFEEDDDLSAWEDDEELDVEDEEESWGDDDEDEGEDEEDEKDKGKKA